MVSIKASFLEAGEIILVWRGEIGLIGERCAERTERGWNRCRLRSMGILRSVERLFGAVGLHGSR